MADTGSRRHEDVLTTLFNNKKKEIYLLWTIHKANVIDTKKRDRLGKIVRKLQVVDDYNKYMNGFE